MFIQIGNFLCENKNMYFYKYLKCLIWNNNFHEIKVDFPPVGYLKEDIDQACSKTSEQLQSNDAITPKYLYEHLRPTFNGTAMVSQMKKIANWFGIWSEMGESSEISKPLKSFTHRYFSFAKSVSNGFIVCRAKCCCAGAWMHFCGGGIEGVGVLIGNLPCFFNTPLTPITCLFEKGDVTKRMPSKEWRIANTENACWPYAWKDYFYHT